MIGLLASASAATSTGEINGFVLVMSLLGGLALFLYGMELMAEALKAVAGERMKGILATLTNNRMMGVLTGTVVTAIIQSSSVTTVLVVGFISAGVMTFTQSIGVILGADIGTTITAQIVAFKVTKYALLMIAGGYGMVFFGRRESVRFYGEGLLGLGLIFLGMGMMGDAMSPLRSYDPFLDLMARMENPLLGVLVAAIFTGLVQSSSATTGIIIVMASEGLVTLPAGIALVYGANIGTCITAMLAAIGRPREALRAAVIHVLFKVVGVSLWIWFIPQLGDIVIWMSPASEDLVGGARLAADTPRQIANAHTVFNVVNTLIFLPFVPQFVRLVEWLVPDRGPEEEKGVRAKYLDEELVHTPALALDRARDEIVHLGELVEGIVADALPVLLNGTIADLQTLKGRDADVDILYGRIVSYLGKISQVKLTDAETAEMVRLIRAVNDLESMGDIVETNMISLGKRRIHSGVSINAWANESITQIHTQVLEAVRLSLIVCKTRERSVAKEIIRMKEAVNQQSTFSLMDDGQRLVGDRAQFDAWTAEVDMIENWKRVYYYCKRIARSAKDMPSLD